MESLKDHVTKYSHSLIYSVLHINIHSLKQNANDLNKSHLKGVENSRDIAGNNKGHMDWNGFGKH